MKYVFIDFEMNPVNRAHKDAYRKCKQEIIEIGAVMLDEEFDEISSFKSYVKPDFNEEITPKCAKLTGITFEKLEEAPDFKAAVHNFINWCAEAAGAWDYEVYAWSKTDYQQFNRELRYKEFGQDDTYAVDVDELAWMIENWKDYQREYCDLVGLDKVLSLENAVRSIGQMFVGQMHDALYDARNTAVIFRLAHDENIRKTVIQPIIDALKPTPPATYKLAYAFEKAMAAKR